MKTRKPSRNLTNSDSTVVKDENETCLVSKKEPSISNSNEETINKINIEEPDKEVEREDRNADKKTVDHKYEFTFQVLESLKKTRCGVPLTKLLTEFKNGSNFMIYIILCLIIQIIFNVFLIRVILYFDMTAVWFRIIFLLLYNVVNLSNFILLIKKNTIIVNIFNIVYLIAFISSLIYLNILFEIIKFTDLDFVHEGFFLGCLILVCLFSYLNLPGRLRLLNAFFLILFTISLVIFCVSYGFNWFIIPYYFGVLILVFIMNIWNMFQNFYIFCFEILSLTILTYFICVYETIKVRSSLIKV